MPWQSPQPKSLPPWAQGHRFSVGLCGHSSARPLPAHPASWAGGRGRGWWGWHPVVCPPQPQPWGGAHGVFPGKKGKARTWGWLHKPSTARQEDRAQQCHQPLSRAGLRGTERGDSTGDGELAWSQHRALAGHPEEASSDKHTAAHSRLLKVGVSIPRMESWGDLEGLTAPCHPPPDQRWLKAWKDPHPCPLGVQVCPRSVEAQGCRAATL